MTKNLSLAEKVAFPNKPTPLLIKDIGELVIIQAIIDALPADKLNELDPEGVYSLAQQLYRQRRDQGQN